MYQQYIKSIANLVINNQVTEFNSNIPNDRIAGNFKKAAGAKPKRSKNSACVVNDVCCFAFHDFVFIVIDDTKLPQEPGFDQLFCLEVDKEPPKADTGSFLE